MSISRCLCALVLGLVAISFATAQSEVKKIAEVEGVTEYRLANGCRVLVMPDQSATGVTVNMTVFVGSRHEGYGETGMAHLLEHMLFKGTPKHGDIDEELKAKGVLNMNGTTWYDRTNYFETLPASTPELADENMDWMIEMEADRLVNCFVRGEDLASEMTVVRNEFERSENNQTMILFARIMSASFDWHNYGKSVIGNKADIELVPIYNLKRFYKKYYRPDNIMVMISGKVDPEKAVASAVKHFGPIENPDSELEKTYTSEPVQDGERVVNLRRSGDVPMMGIGYHVPAVAHADHAAVEVLDWIMGDNPSGRLYNALVKERLASSVSTRIEAGHDPGMLLCFASIEDGVTMDDFNKKMTAAIEKIVADGVTEAEVKRAIASIMKEKEEAPNDSEQFTMTLSDWAAYGDWRLFYLHRDRISKVTAEQVNAMAKKYLKRDNRTVGIFSPTKEADRTTVPSTPRVADLVKDYKGRAAVAEGEAFEATPENIATRIERGLLDSGVKFALLPKQSRGGQFSLQLTLRYGTEESLNNPANLAAASMMPSMFTKGTASLSRQDIEDRKTELKCDLTVSGDKGFVNFTVQGRKEHLVETLDLLVDIIRNPSFPAEELELLKSAQISGIEAQKSSPQMQAIVTMTKKLNPVGKDNIHYALDLDEQVERIKSVTVDSIKSLYDEFLSGSHGELTAVGSFDSATVKEKLTAALNDWASTKEYARIPEVHFDFVPEEIVLETPDKAMAIMVMATTMPMSSSAPDWEAMYLANDILGGGSMTSRLGTRVREEKGLSYSVGSQFQAEALDEASSFLTFAITNPANRDELKMTVNEVFDALLDDGVSEDEVKASQTSYAKSIEDMLGSDRQLMNVLHQYQHYDRDESYLRGRLDRMSKVTPEEVSSAARKLLNDRKFITVMAGDFANAKAEDKIKQK